MPAAMALVTYTLLSALSSGLQSRFHPEVLGYSLSKAMAAVIAEFCIIKLGCYLLDVRGGGASGVELMGYGGYKFVGSVLPAASWLVAERGSIIVTILMGLTNLGTWLRLAVFVYTYLANAFFLVRGIFGVSSLDSHVTASIAQVRPAARPFDRGRCNAFSRAATTADTIPTGDGGVASAMDGLALARVDSHTLMQMKCRCSAWPAVTSSCMDSHGVAIAKLTPVMQNRNRRQLFRATGSTGPAKVSSASPGVVSTIFGDCLKQTPYQRDRADEMPRYLCFCPDYPDALERRFAVRERHLAEAKKDLDSGVQCRAASSSTRWSA